MQAAGSGQRASGVGRRASGIGRRASDVGHRASGGGRRWQRRYETAATLYENDQLLLKFVLEPDVNGFGWLQACDCQFVYDICST